MKVAAALVGRVSRPVPDPPGPAPGWVDGRGRRGRRPQTWRSAPLPDPAPQRNFRESAEGGRTGALGSGRVGRTGSGPMAPVGRPDGAGFKPGNRKGLRLWCLGINRLQTKTETPFRFRRRSCARSTLQNAHVRAPAASPAAALRRVFGSGAFSIASQASGNARRDMSGGGRSPPRRAVEQRRRWRKGFEDTVPGFGFPDSRLKPRRWDYTLPLERAHYEAAATA